MKVTSKKLQVIAPKMSSTLKEIQSSKKEKPEVVESTYESVTIIQKNCLVLVMAFETLERTQKTINIGDDQTIKLWLVNDIILQFLKRLALEEMKCQVLVTGESI